MSGSLEDDGEGDGVIGEKEGFRTEVLPDGRILAMRKVRQVLPSGEVYEGEVVENRRHGRGVLTKPDGSRYVGEFADGLFEGKGTLTLGEHRVAGRVVRGWKYVGGWVGGRREGEGLWVSGEGGVYEGGWKSDRFHGFGRETKADGEVYEGSFALGMRHGEGELRMAKGMLYRGGFLKGQFHGEGEMMYGRGGGSYKGTFRLGKRHGIGRRVWSTGAEYEGEWRDDFPWGRGVYRATNGDVYVGDFEEGKYHGHGTLQFAHGDRYVGQLQRNKPCGVGRMEYASGGFYEGEFWALARTGVPWRREEGEVGGGEEEEGMAWKKGGKKVSDVSETVSRKRRQKERLRRMYDHQHPLPKAERLRLVMEHRKVGRVLVGSDEDDPEAFPGVVRPVADGKRHGRGLRVWTSGARYEGDWFQDEMHGFGIYIGPGPTGERYEGQFRRGKRHGRGVCSYGNTAGGTYVCPLGRRLPGDQRSIYDGEWHMDMFHGTGKFIWGDGRSYVGGFHRGAKQGFGVEVFLTRREIERELAAPGGDVRMVHRIKQYEGQYQAGAREGRGKAIMATGDEIEGNFIQGRLNGPVKYTFKSGRTSYALFEMGHRKRWLRGRELEETLSAEAALALVRGDQLSTASLRAQLKERSRAREEEEEAAKARSFDLKALAVQGHHDPVARVGAGAAGKRALQRERNKLARKERKDAEDEIREKFKLGRERGGDESGAEDEEDWDGE